MYKHFFFVGLKFDDLLIESNPDVETALKLLPKEETYARHFRYKRAFQLSLMHRVLPKDQWTKPEEDIPYLQPYIEQAHQERKEREAFEHPVKKKLFSL
jgi:ubiquinol-cytochrome c reductase subunit 7